ncbi:hypothetical protein EMCRGX_G030167 [Ephydatia muelleri]|eukprot:Em0010g376a
MASERPVARKLDYLFKLVLVGDAGVGKTSLLRRMSNDEFVANPTITTSVAIDFKTRILDIDGKRIKLQIWDTAGQERYSMKSITKAYFRGSSCVVIVYDITSDVSYDNARQWLIFLQEYNILDDVMVLGNKSDLAETRAVSVANGKLFAKEYNGIFMEVSAKTGENVELALISLAKKIKDSKEHKNREPSCTSDVSESIVVEKDDSRPRKRCLSSCN